jgi:FkbM family methyltransferase
MAKYGILTLLKSGLMSPDLAFRFFRGKDPSEIEISILEKFLGTNSPVILEAGAFDGADTLRFANLWADGKIYSFEPVPNLFEALSVKVAGYKNIQIFDKALVGNSEKNIELYTFSNSEFKHGSSSILKPVAHLEISPEVKFGDVKKVSAITLDEWVIENDLTRIDLLWLDLQGAELQVLKAGAKALSITKVCHVEVSRYPLYEGGAKFSEIHELMVQQGFQLKVCRIPVVSGNALYVKNNSF